MIKLSEAIKIWLSEWHLCEMCNQMHYKQISCDDDDDGVADGLELDSETNYLNNNFDDEDDGRDREWNEIND